MQARSGVNASRDGKNAKMMNHHLVNLHRKEIPTKITKEHTTLEVLLEALLLPRHHLLHLPQGTHPLRLQENEGTNLLRLLESEGTHHRETTETIIEAMTRME